MKKETNTTPEAVAAMIAVLRYRSTADDMCGNCFDEERASAADLLAAVAAERDALTERCKAQARDLAMVEHSLKLAYAIRTALGWNDKHSLDIMPDAVKRMVSDLAAARATIARLEREKAEAEALLNANEDSERARIAEAVEAEREACAKIAAEESFGIDISVWISLTKKEMTAHVALAIANAIRARASKGTEI